MKLHYIVRDSNYNKNDLSANMLVMYKSVASAQSFNAEKREIKDINVTSPLMDFTSISHVKKLIIKIIPKEQKISLSSYKKIMHNLQHSLWTPDDFVSNLSKFLKGKIKLDSVGFTILENNLQDIINSYSFYCYRSSNNTKIYVLKHTN